MPKLPSLFKTPRAKQFEYKPIYYNADKEEMEERYERIKAELNIQDRVGHAERMANFQNRLHTRWERKNKNRKANKQATFRLLIIAMALLALAWWIIH